MAQKVIVSFVDDIDGGEAESTVSFGIDGKSYEIDLSSENAAKLRDALAPFVGVARRSGGSSRAAAAAAPPARATQDRERNQAIRDWATSQGLEIAERGRIAKEIVEAYEASQRSGGSEKAEKAEEKTAEKSTEKAAEKTSGKAADKDDEKAGSGKTRKKGVSAPVFSGG